MRVCGLVGGDNLAVDDGLVRQGEQRRCDRGIAAGKVLVVARAQIGLAARLEANRAVAVELEFIEPLRSFGQSAYGLQEHRLDEVRVHGTRSVHFH